jgi:hypothetical protein
MESWNEQVHSLLVEIAEERLEEEYPLGEVMKEYSFLFEAKKLYRVDVVGGNGSESHAYECVVSAYPTLAKLEALKKTFHKVTVLTVSDVILRAMEIVNIISEQRSHISDLQALIDDARQERFKLKENIRKLKWEIRELKRHAYAKVRYWQKKAKKK